MATTPPRTPARPAHDEWGVYDPDQAGLTALFARLDSKAKAKAASTTAENAPAKPAPRKDLRDQ